MYENDLNSIRRAQNGDKSEMSKLIEDNNRAYMEHSKTIYK